MVTITVTPNRWRIIGPFVLGIGILAIVLGLALNASVLFDLITPPAVTLPGEVFVITSPIRRGDTLVLQVIRCAWAVVGNDDVPATITRQLSSATTPVIVVLPAANVAIPTGCNTVQSRLNIIPADLPPGLWRLNGTVTARHRTTSWTTAVFEVVL